MRYPGVHGETKVKDYSALLSKVAPIIETSKSHQKGRATGEVANATFDFTEGWVQRPCQPHSSFAKNAPVTAQNCTVGASGNGAACIGAISHISQPRIFGIENEKGVMLGYAPESAQNAERRQRIQQDIGNVYKIALDKYQHK